MTKKHYIAIAAILKEARNVNRRTFEMQESAEDAVENITQDLADLFQQDNPLFDRDKFLNAVR